MENKLVNLILDTVNGKVSAYASDKAENAEDAVKKAFEEILGGQFNYASWRRHKNEIFEIIEETLASSLPEAWKSSPFYNEFVEVKNLALGDKNEFAVDDYNDTLVAVKFSGNHWDTDRTKLAGKQSFSMPTYWIHIRVYDEFERFMKGLITLPEMYAHIQSAFQRYVDGSVYTAFSGIESALPTGFTKSGSFVKADMIDLAETVQTAANKEVVIAGTKSALAKLNADYHFMSDDMKNALNKNGIIPTFEGIQLVEIPQVFNVGTYTKKIPNNKLYVLPRGVKPIKAVWEGDVRTRELNEQDTHDQTIDVDSQAKFGLGLVLNELIGTYTITA